MGMCSVIWEKREYSDVVDLVGEMKFFKSKLNSAKTSGDRLAFWIHDMSEIKWNEYEEGGQMRETGEFFI